MKGIRELIDTTCMELRGNKMANILEKPIYRRHSLKCYGNFRMTKKGVDGNPWEFQCDECQSGMCIMNADSLTPDERVKFDKFVEYVKKFGVK